MTEKVGDVNLVLDYYTQVDHYSDGDVEDDILEIVQADADYDKAILQDDRWPVFYHLTKRRETILQPVQLSKMDRVLEIGAGCGALTGAIAERALQVDCIELSKRRSLINAYRNKQRNNINIYVGNYQDVELDQKYDVVLLIGVFEYAASYIASANPYMDFLAQVREKLNPNGRLYIAIENRFGLKYLSGCQEDHSGIAFDGVEGYPRGGHVRTFSREELADMLERAHFSDLVYYYPFPDYKIPTVIFSDDYLPTQGMLKGRGVSYSGERNAYFDEELVYRSLYSQDFRFFSNSFLIEAKAGK